MLIGTVLFLESGLYGWRVVAVVFHSFSPTFLSVCCEWGLCGFFTRLLEFKWGLAWCRSGLGIQVWRALGFPVEIPRCICSIQHFRWESFQISLFFWTIPVWQFWFMSIKKGAGSSPPIFERKASLVGSRLERGFICCWFKSQNWGKWYTEGTVWYWHGTNRWIINFLPNSCLLLLP